jgi:hypothetical protein
VGAPTELLEPHFPEPLPVWRTLADALAIYRLLFKRSVMTAAVVYAVIALVDLGHHALSGQRAQVLALVSFVAGFGGPLVVQGALVQIVRNVHEGAAPEEIPALFRRARERLWALLGAAIVYGAA